MYTVLTLGGLIAVALLIVALFIFLIIYLTRNEQSGNGGNTIKKIQFGIDVNGMGVGFSWTPLPDSSVLYAWTMYEVNATTGVDGDVVVIGPLSPSANAYVNPELFQLGKTYRIYITADKGGKTVATGNASIQYTIKTFSSTATITNHVLYISTTSSTNPLSLSIRDTSVSRYVDSRSTNTIFKDYTWPQATAISLLDASFTVNENSLVITLVDKAANSISMFTPTPTTTVVSGGPGMMGDTFQSQLLAMMDDDNSTYVPWTN